MNGTAAYSELETVGWQAEVSLILVSWRVFVLDVCARAKGILTQ